MKQCGLVTDFKGGHRYCNTLSSAGGGAASRGGKISRSMLHVHYNR